MRYILIILISGILLSCDAVDCYTAVTNTSSYPVDFKVGADTHSLEVSESSSFKNEGDLEYKGNDFTKISHSRVILDHTRHDFTDEYTFKDNGGIALYIHNTSGEPVRLTSIGIFNATDSVPTAFKTKGSQPLYGYIMVGIDNNTADPVTIENNQSASDAYGTIFTLTPTFIAIDTNMSERTVTYYVEDGTKMHVTIR